MTTRTTTKTVNFARSFTLNEADGARPPGLYTVETEEQRRNFLGFSLYRRVSTMMHRSDPRAENSLIRFVTIDPVELGAALSRERQLPAQYD